MNKFLTRFMPKHKQKPLKRYMISTATINEFLDEQTAKAFINTQLEMRGFDMHKPVIKYTSESKSIILFEQE